MQKIKVFAWAGAVMLMATAPSFAMGWWIPGHGGDNGGGKPPQSHSAPGPVIGIGLPALAIAGGYALYMIRRRK